MDIIEDEVIEQAAKLFHVALDRHVGSEQHWVDSGVEAVAEALLMEGWKLPESAS